MTATAEDIKAALVALIGDDALIAEDDATNFAVNVLGLTEWEIARMLSTIDVFDNSYPLRPMWSRSDVVVRLAQYVTRRPSCRFPLAP